MDRIKLVKLNEKKSISSEVLGICKISDRKSCLFRKNVRLLLLRGLHLVKRCLGINLVFVLQALQFPCSLFFSGANHDYKIIHNKKLNVFVLNLYKKVWWKLRLLKNSTKREMTEIEGSPEISAFIKKLL